MKLCTFEVATHLGRHSRLGAFRSGRIVDLNFATAWYLAQQGEPEPQRLADALVPANFQDFLCAGLRSLHSAEELFLGAGPNPADWWKLERPPRGPNDETLVYRPEEVRLRPPVPGPGRLGSDEEVRCDGGPRCEWKLAAVIGKAGANIRRSEAMQHVAGFTAVIDFGALGTAIGPYLVTRDRVPNPYELDAAAYINGEAYKRTSSGLLRPRFEDLIEAASRGKGVQPGEVIASCLPLELPVYAGDVVELEIAQIGTLRSRVV
jgi:2-keto-4-pentenoate hydratase/2-oxohepta-3-ene-1,7-dioic acid hydratase in catechol pathway